MKEITETHDVPFVGVTLAIVTSGVTPHLWARESFLHIFTHIILQNYNFRTYELHYLVHAHPFPCVLSFCMSSFPQL